MIKKTLGFFSYCFAVVFVLWLIGFCIFCAYALSFKLQPRAATEAIVVLTGGNARVQKGIDLLEQTKSEHLLISGVNKTVTLSEIMERAMPFLQPRITLGYLATNTKENAIETAYWIQQHDIRSITLVTSFYHMPRSLFEIQRLEPNLVIVPEPVFPKRFDESVDWIYTRYAWLLFVEYHKFLVVYTYHLIERIF